MTLHNIIAGILFVAGFFAMVNESDHIWINILGIATIGTSLYLFHKWDRNNSNEYI